MESVALRTCVTCKKTLKGRSDKKFCDDYCRNTHNNRVMNEDTALIKTINGILKKNRKILLEFLKEDAFKTVDRLTLTDKGFQFKYFTHQIANKKNDVYFFCYEYGYLPIADRKVLVVRGKESPQSRLSPEKANT